MKPKNHYFILRHGDTVWTKTKKTYPWPDGSLVRLNREGIRTIKTVAERLKKQKIDLIYASDLYRTTQTAMIVAKALGLNVTFDKRLRDTYLGSYHGRSPKEFYRDFPNMEKRFRIGPKDGESWNDVKTRVKSFISDLEEKHQGKTILIVSHGDPLWLFAGIVNNLNNNDLLKVILNKDYIKKGELRKLV
ncbi:MAG: histidine phosphatase family protein [bacterium]